MADETPPWTSRSVLVSVSDLDRSAAFYQQLLGVHEILRDDQLAVLHGSAGQPLAIYLRQALRGATHSGQDSLGVRSLGFDVGSFAALDRIEEILRASDAFRDRQSIPTRDTFQVIRGEDPDRFPLNFVADESGEEMTVADYSFVIRLMYAIDV
jgi:catechol 2,3-dioxygenase-like lactoylglutathione lyase family enzyme